MSLWFICWLGHVVMGLIMLCWRCRCSMSKGAGTGGTGEAMAAKAAKALVGSPLKKAKRIAANIARDGDAKAEQRARKAERRAKRSPWLAVPPIPYTKNWFCIKCTQHYGEPQTVPEDDLCTAYDKSKAYGGWCIACCNTHPNSNHPDGRAWCEEPDDDGRVVDAPRSDPEETKDAPVVVAAAAAATMVTTTMHQPETHQYKCRTCAAMVSYHRAVTTVDHACASCRSGAVAASVAIGDKSCS